MVAHVSAAHPQLLRTRAAAGGNAPQPRLNRPKIKISCSPAKGPGKANFYADATSRRPVRSDDDDCETLFIAANLAAIAISREEAAAEAQEDPEYLAMHSTLSQGVALNAATCNEFFQYRDKLYPRDGVLLYDDRLVIPEGLREKVLDVLHPAHQGKLSMLHRVALTVFWPG